MAAWVHAFVLFIYKLKSYFIKIEIMSIKIENKTGKLLKMTTQKVDRFCHSCGELHDENDCFCVKCGDKRRSKLDSEGNK